MKKRHHKFGRQSLCMCGINNNTAPSIYLVHQMAAEASKEEMGTDSRENEPAKGGEDFHQDHQDHQALQLLEILTICPMILRITSKMPQFSKPPTSSLGESI